MKGFSPK
jgi:hypothetical protein